MASELRETLNLSWRTHLEKLYLELLVRLLPTTRIKENWWVTPGGGFSQQFIILI